MEEKHTLRTKSLYKFLMKYRLFTKYINNVRNQHPNQREIIAYNEDGDILQLLSVKENISGSFCWANTPQGHKFWSNLSDKERFEYYENQRVYNIMHAPTTKPSSIEETSF